MASTNKTTNYELSQFIGTDKPAWLTDYNADMSKIDAGVATAQSTATGADGKATANATAIGNISSLTTTAKNNLVAAVNEVNTSASTALNTANNAAGNASQAIAKVNDLADYLTMSNIVPVSYHQIVPTAGTIDQYSTVTITLNEDATFGKIYGRVMHTPTNAGWNTITLNIDSGIHPDTEFTISPAGLGFPGGKNVEMTFKTNGNITLKYYADTNSMNTLFLWPCCYFFADFGDTPNA
jgi:hypothetical protein